MRLLLDEMYGRHLVEALKARGVTVATARELGLGGVPDDALLAFAAAHEMALLTENVADFTRIAAQWSAEGRHHAGLLVALATRFSCRPGGAGTLADTVAALSDEPLGDRVVYLIARR
jgi:hypothetical protein